MENLREPAAAAAGGVDVGKLERALRREVQGEVRFDAGARALYATDASNYRQPPLGMVAPASVDDLVAAVGVCRDHGAPILPRGGGTSLAGQCCNVAVVLDVSRHLGRVLDVDPGSKTARVEPGVVLDDLRGRAERDHGLTFGPDPSTHAWCTLGGMIGNNACGVHSVMAGRTADNIASLDVLTYDGARFHAGPTSEAELERIVAAGGRRGRIYRILRGIRDSAADEIRQRFPRIPRRVSGYNLDELLPENGFHVGRSLVGTEGTCALVLEAVVDLVPSPGHRVLLVLGYPGVAAAGDAVPQVLEHGPIGLEGLDGTLVRCMRAAGLHTGDVELLPRGDAWLLVELGGEDREGCRSRALDLLRDLGRSPGDEARVYDDPADAARIWDVRRSGVGATARMPGGQRTWPGWEDAAVPPQRVGDYLRDFNGLLERYGYACAIYGHFGDGCIHARIDFDLQSHSGVARYLDFVGEAADLVVAHGGSLSGEHGDGRSRGFLLERMFGPRLVEAFRRFKSAWDPRGRLNPGRVVDPAPPDADLRVGPGYKPWEPGTWYAYRKDEGSLAQAALRCVGVGRCRRLDAAFMCPSYLATRDETHSTRGRARLLFEMLEGSVIRDGWRSEAVREALDLCLGCKACKRECPVGVDMAAYKSEFLAQHYAGRLRPRSAYAMGLVGAWAVLGGMLPGLSNLLSGLRPFSDVTKLLAGIDRGLSLPRFASRKARRRFWGSLPRGEGPRVMLLPDVYHEFFRPQVLVAAGDVLEAAGFRVEPPPGRIAAIRPLLHYGMLDRARGRLREVLDLLRGPAREGVPMVAVEPSMVSVYRDELQDLFPGDPDAPRLADQVLLLEELLDRRAVELPPLGGRAVFHGHCHQKAVLDAEAPGRVLRRLGLDLHVPDPGCCGMAGSFGFEARHAGVARKIGERHLLPAVRAAAPGDLVVAGGFSCGEQMRQGAGRQALHPAEVLSRAFRAAAGDPPQRA